MPTGTNVTAADRKLIEALHRKGIPGSAIAVRVGLRRWAVYKVLAQIRKGEGKGVK